MVDFTLSTRVRQLQREGLEQLWVYELEYEAVQAGKSAFTSFILLFLPGQQDTQCTVVLP